MNAITFDATGWTAAPCPPGEAGCVQSWRNAAGDELSLCFYDSAPERPIADEALDAWRRQYRGLLAPVGGGLVELIIVTLDGLPALKIVGKMPQPHGGNCYLGMLSLLRQSFSYAFKLECPEHGFTGLREAVVLDRELARVPVGAGAPGIPPGWAADPYDTTIRGRGLRTRADDAAYDAEFPEHPLSRLRRTLHGLERSVTIAANIKERLPISGRARPGDHGGSSDSASSAWRRSVVATLPKAGARERMSLRSPTRTSGGSPNDKSSVSG
jgi:hypothetical protein